MARTGTFQLRVICSWYKMKNKSITNKYSSGEFAKRAHVTLRTIRYYDQKNILKPSFRNRSGARFYTDEDLARLQQILLLKYLGFSLDEIREMTIASEDEHFLLESLRIQRKLVEERMEQMKAMIQAIDSTTDAIQTDRKINWQSILDLIHITSMEQSLKTQYVNANNISARIQLHRDFSTNPEGWFPWILEQLPLKDGMKILEIGCGNGAMWLENLEQLPLNIEVILSDTSEGMLRDAHRNLGEDARFTYRQFDCVEIPFQENEFDLVIANHVLFYCDEIDRVLTECARVMKEDGQFVCSTYGKKHMIEITQLVQEFNEEIVLSQESLYDRFGLENGESILSGHFLKRECLRYPDSIEINEADPLIWYILSCHGNQNQLLLDKYREFHDYVAAKTEHGFHITKDAGIFLCSGKTTLAR